MGYITKGRGITVHQKNCRNIQLAQQNKPERLIDINWENQSKKKVPAWARLNEYRHVPD